MAAPLVIGRFTPGTPEWEESRRSHLGGSEIAAVLGLSPWTSPFTLWHTKAGLIPYEPGNRYTEWGNRLEPVVADKFCEDHEAEYDPWPDRNQALTFAHPERTWQSASPDLGLIRRADSVESFLEVKTSARPDSWYDGIPVYYRTQVLWTMDVLGVDHAWLAALIGGSDYREFLIELDADAEADLTIMRDAGQQFMASLADGTPPNIDDSYSTWQTIRRTHPDIELDTEREVDRETAVAYCDANQVVQEAGRVQQRARSAIARHLGNAQYAVCDGVRIARRQPARDGGPPVLVSTRKHLPEETL